MKKTLFFTFFLALLTIHAQNLVPNSGFEDCNTIPSNWMTSDYTFEAIIKNWNAPSQCSPDILFPGSFPFFKKRPNIELKDYRPRTGKLMLGMKLYGCGQTMHCKEYIQVQLREPMHKGYRYVIEFWTKPIETSMKVNNIGFALGSIEVNDSMGFNLYYIDPIYETTAIVQTKEWVKIADTICADQDYEYLIIGNFKPDARTNTRTEEGGLDYAYYLFDDVKIERIGNKCGETTVSIEDFFDFRNIQFELKSAQLLQSSLKELDKLVEHLQNHPLINIQINGHTDNIGTVEDNQQLSENRSKSVFEYLNKQGIDRTRMQINGYGEEQPIADNATKNGRKLNRRVEVIELPVVKKAQ